MKLKHLAFLTLLVAAPAHAAINPQLVERIAARNGIPNRLLESIIHIESGGNCRARNGHALGVGQVMPRTARSVGVYGSLFDCRNGLEAAARYLRLALARGGRGCAGVSLYNSGLWARPRCSSYGRRVLALYYGRRRHV